MSRRFIIKIEGKVVGTIDGIKLECVE